MKTERSEGTPHDRLTRITDAMTTTLEGHPEATGDERCLVLLYDGTEGGIVMNGYEDDAEAIVDLLVHLRAMFKANGKELAVVPMPAMGMG